MVPYPLPDLNRPVQRKGTASVKHDRTNPDVARDDLVPLWVADMDFPAPVCAVEAVAGRADHGIFGYTDVSEGLATAAAAWVAEREGWEPDPSWLVVTPGVVFAVAQAIRAFTDPGDAVLIQPPVYYPFSAMVGANGRVTAEAPLSYDEGRAREGFDAAVAGEPVGAHPYGFDAEAFAAALDLSGARMFVLCNPHNPVGRAWTAEELEVMARICAARDVFVVADEIHADFARPGRPHVPFSPIARAAGCRHLVACAPSKTFNLAGMQLSCIWVPDPDVRARFAAAVEATGYSGVNPLSQAAAEACFSDGGPWLDAVKDYLEDNLAWVNDFVAREIPELTVVQPDGTYLLWVDCRDLGLGAEELDRLMGEEAGLWLDMGTMFGAGGEGFARFNLATQRSVLEEAFGRLRDAVAARR